MSGSLSPAQRVQALVCQALAFGTLREKLGLSRVRVAICSGAPPSDAARDGIQAMGVALVEVQSLDAGGLLGAGAPA
jgi:long-subunit acyl-CoA synthetase (AMP-forming)